jgi:glycosyltransferase 2 family protein
MRKTISTTLRYLVSLALGGLFLYWAFHETDPTSLWAEMRGVPLAWVLGIVVLTLLAIAIRAWRWVILMRPAAPKVSLWHAMKALVICYAANAAIPRSGEALRALSVRWACGASVSSVLATVVVERVLDLIWMVIFVGISVAIVPSTLTATYPWLKSGVVVVLVSCVTALAMMLWISIYREQALRLTSQVIGLLSKRVASVVVDLLDKFIHGLAALRTPSAYLHIVASSTLLNFAYVLMVYFGFRAFGFHVGPYDLGLAEALVVMTVSTIGVIIPTPGGVGSYHLFFGQSLHILFGVPDAAALACATMIHAVSAILFIALGVPTFIHQRRRADRTKGANS